ncbi:MAG: type I restriction enzyme HsdR N-terminal domain-containing protein [Dissulfuribacterales bacterium]
MPDNTKSYDMLVDYITGKTLPNIGVEEIRQDIERFLVEKKGYQKSDITVNFDVEIDIAGSIYQSQLDLVVSVDDKRFMVIKCAAGSLESRRREVLSAARIADACQIPYAVASDGKTAVIYDTISGKKTGASLSRIPSRKEATETLSKLKPLEISKKRREKEKLIFRSYDSMNVNVSRKIKK